MVWAGRVSTRVVLRLRVCRRTITLPAKLPSMTSGRTDMALLHDREADSQSCLAIAFDIDAREF